MSYHYGVPPEHYQKFYDTPSPHSSGEYVQYVPAPYLTTPTSRHTRKQSHYESPRVGGWFSPAGSPPPCQDQYGHYHTPRRETHVSYETRSPPDYGMPSSYTRHSRKQSQPIHISGDDGVEYAKPLPKYVRREQYHPSSKPKTSKHGKKASTDSYFDYHQEQVYEEQPKRSRARASTNTKQPPKHKPTSSKSAPQATEKDAIRAGIPAGYSYKNWDPTEKPIILLGSVFDANSLGKWIYDWTVYHHGASTPLADIAGDLWLLLIKLAGKMKRAEDCIKRIRKADDREMMEDFIISGARLWEKFKSLLKDCEYYMMKAAKREGSKTMGKNAGTEFVDSIFGRERFLEKTEALMVNVRLWNMRFDVNCEDILRHRAAA